MDRPLPILSLPVREQRYSCHGCGNCCKDFTVQLRERDLQKLREQRWEERLGEPVTVEFRDRIWLRQREDGSCVFLQEDGKCRIHAEFGFAEKPTACQLFPFVLVPDETRTRAGLSFACQSVRENKGAQLSTHLAELERMSADIPETRRATDVLLLAEALHAKPGEIACLEAVVDVWFSRTDITLRDRWDGFAWLSTSLARAQLRSVRETRFKDLVQLLASALPEELHQLGVDRATKRQSKLLRQGVFARLEDVKISSAKSKGRLRVVLGQLLRSARFSRGKGVIPNVAQGFLEGVRFELVAASAPLSDSPDANEIDMLFSRYARAMVLGGRAWGAGYYGWPAVRGMQALALNIACTAWVARARAAKQGRSVALISDVEDALGRIDRAAGRAPWLGAVGERVRLDYFRLDDGLRRILRDSI